MIVFAVYILVRKRGQEKKGHDPRTRHLKMCLENTALGDRLCQ